MCGGNNSSCAGCDGVANSGKVVDLCGVCNGGGIAAGTCSCDGDVLDQCGVCVSNTNTHTHTHMHARTHTHTFFLTTPFFLSLLMTDFYRCAVALESLLASATAEEM